MNQPTKYTIKVSGDVAATNKRTVDAKTFDYLIVRLFRGEEVAPEALALYGVTVEIEAAR